MRSQFTERRVCPRVNMTLPVEFVGASSATRSDRGVLNCEVFDLSKNGVRIISDRGFAVEKGDELDIRINLPPCYSGDPRKALPIDIAGGVRWTSSNALGNRNECGLEFLDVESKKKSILDNVVTSELERALRIKVFGKKLPKFEVNREIHACNMYTTDLTVGCEHDCVYCHFAKYRKDEWLKKMTGVSEFPVAVDLEPLYRMKKLPESVVYLSSSSDAFAPSARDAAHEVLSYLLPKGVKFTISTKNVIPDRTIKLLKKHAALVEGVSVGITNLDEKRNSVLEPGCPSAEERLSGAEKLLDIGCGVCVRMDPMFPVLDDTEESMTKTINAIYNTGIRHVSGTYIFTFGSILREMKRNPYLRKAASEITAKTYPIGGKALSVSMERKKRTYSMLNDICRSKNMVFMTCGCKDTQLRDEGYSLICRNMDYYDGKGNTVE